jgi:hypothetical protein
MYYSLAMSRGSRSMEQQARIRLCVDSLKVPARRQSVEDSEAKEPGFRVVYNDRKMASGSGDLGGYVPEGVAPPIVDHTSRVRR